MEEVCDRDTFRGNCPAGSVLEMTAARYGRVKVGGCISSDLGFLGCGKDALPEMDAWCSGRQSCSVKVDDEENEDLNQGNTCDKDIASHLEVNYQCVRGTSCYKFDYVSILHSFLSSFFYFFLSFFLSTSFGLFPYCLPYLPLPCIFLPPYLSLVYITLPVLRVTLIIRCPFDKISFLCCHLQCTRNTTAVVQRPSSR